MIDQFVTVVAAMSLVGGAITAQAQPDLVAKGRAVYDAQKCALRRATTTRFERGFCCTCFVPDTQVLSVSSDLSD